MPELPHVTEILARAGLIDATWFTEDARDRGTALHQATRFLDEGDLEVASVDPVVLSRFRQYQIFLDEVRPEILTIEEKVTNEALQYQGQLDRRVRIVGREGIIDIKPPSKYPWQAVQLAMYAACFNRPLVRWTLHLSDERYQLIEHRGRMDWEVAKAAITIAAWRQNNDH